MAVAQYVCWVAQHGQQRRHLVLRTEDHATIVETACGMYEPTVALHQVKPGPRGKHSLVKVQGPRDPVCRECQDWFESIYRQEGTDNG